MLSTISSLSSTSCAGAEILPTGIALVVFILIIGGGIAVILENSVIFPIARLTYTADKISRGKHSERADIEGDDEVARLGRAFNAMLEKLELSRVELVRSNTELEGEIASRRSAEEAIRHREEELRVIFESTPIMMALLDLDMKLRKVNRTWKTYVVGEGRDSFGRSFGEALHCVNALSSSEGCGTTEQCRNCRLRAALVGAVEKQVPMNQVEATLERKIGRDSEDVHLLVSAPPLYPSRRNGWCWSASRM
jgi:PAS domain-containing protein